MTGSPDVRGGLERFLSLPVAGLVALHVDQAATEYGSTIIRDGIGWTTTFAQERWYYLVGGVVLLVLLWRYLSR